MTFPERDDVDRLKAAWTDKRVRVKPGVRPELARFEGKNGLGRWRIADGRHAVAVGRSAGDLTLTAATRMEGLVFGR